MMTNLYVIFKLAVILVINITINCLFYLKPVFLDCNNSDKSTKRKNKVFQAKKNWNGIIRYD